MCMLYQRRRPLWKSKLDVSNSDMQAQVLHQLHAVYMRHLSALTWTKDYMKKTTPGRAQRSQSSDDSSQKQLGSINAKYASQPKGVMLREQRLVKQPLSTITLDHV